MATYLVREANERLRLRHPKLWRRCSMLLQMAAAVLALAALAAALVAMIGMFGGISSGPNVDWQAVGALAGFAAAVAAAATLAVLLQSLPDLERNAQDSRTARGPYVRADLAFLEPWGRQRNFDLPEDLRVYSLPELGAEQPPIPSQLSGAEGEDAWTLILCARNLQTQPLGIADDVSVRIVLRAEGVPPVSFVVTLAYLAPQQVTAVNLARIRKDVSNFIGVVREVRYQDVFGNASVDTHGALELMYDGGKPFNNREVRRAKGNPSR